MHEEAQEEVEEEAEEEAEEVEEERFTDRFSFGMTFAIISESFYSVFFFFTTFFCIPFFWVQQRFLEEIPRYVIELNLKNKQKREKILTKKPSPSHQTDSSMTFFFNNAHRL